MVALNFDCRTVDPASIGQDVVEAGWYNVVTVASEERDTKDKTGKMLVFDEKVIDGPAAGKIIVNRMNHKNASAQASEMAARSLSSKGHVCGILLIADSQMLHNIPHKIKVDVSFNEQGKPIGNNVIGYADMNGNLPSAAGHAAAPVSPQGAHSAQGQQPPAAQGWGNQAPPAPQQMQPQQPMQQPAPGGWGNQPPPAQQPQQMQPAPVQQPAPAAGGWGGAPTNQAPQQQPAPGGAGPWGPQGGAQVQPAPAAWGQRAA